MKRPLTDKRVFGPIIPTEKLGNFAQRSSNPVFHTLKLACDDVDRTSVLDTTIIDCEDCKGVMMFGNPITGMKHQAVNIDRFTIRTEDDIVETGNSDDIMNLYDEHKGAGIQRSPRRINRLSISDPQRGRGHMIKEFGVGGNELNRTRSTNVSTISIAEI